MGIALFGRYDFIIGSQAGIPSTVDIIVKFSTQTLQCGICQFSTAFMSKESANTVYMSHTAGNPCLPVTVFTKVIRPTARRRKSMSEVQKSVTDFFEKFLVFIGINQVFLIFCTHFVIPQRYHFCICSESSQIPFFTVILYSHKRQNSTGENLCFRDRTL